MSGREYIKNSILLCQEKKGKGIPKKFVIERGISDSGSSSLCYQAIDETKKERGVLKEFYPRLAYGMERDSHGQLVSTPGYETAREQFLKAKDEYTRSYKTLVEARMKKKNHDLDTFIPRFEIYSGCDESGNVVGTTYIWTPNPLSVTFETICEEIHAKPTRKPEYNLVKVLKSIQTLTECVCALHKAGFIHRDINPSNFGFMKREGAGREGEVLTEAISLFDINSIYNINGPEEKIIGTEYYMEPEVQEEEASIQTDIYSIGATLFHAIIVTEEVKKEGFHFRREFYDRIGQMVDESTLIRASEVNSYPRLKKILTVILEKCLADRKNRYMRCEELVDDLKKALFYLIPAEIAKKNTSGQTWMLKDVEESLDINREKNSFLAIQYHLYEHPLYQCSPEDGAPLNVLIIGLGNYGQKFLDACLQNGQMRNRRLDITVISREETDWVLYLEKRPELGKFFTIHSGGNGASANIASSPDRISDSEIYQDSYGDITFETRFLELKDRKSSSNVLRDILHDYYTQKKHPYIFIALGEDSKNREAAKAVQKAVKDLTKDGREIDCFISYAMEDENKSAISGHKICPVYINRNIRNQDIERMAFNAHLVWEKNLNINFAEVRREYNKPYNHDSCVSIVLSLKYKLFSMGIDLTEMTATQAAEAFMKKTGTAEGAKLKDELIWIEHRRWVAEKLCLGWKTRELSECEDGETKDERVKSHICIQKSRPDQKLAREYGGNHYEKWDNASRQELERLDALDRMSVELHRVYVRKAMEARKNNLLSGGSITEIRHLINGKRKSMIAFQEWYSCLKDIWAGDIRQVRLYKGLKDTFLNAAKEELSKKQKKVVDQLTAAFEQLFNPIRFSMEYRDWKQEDTNFINNIPFILTYTENSYLVVPFRPGKYDNTEKFENVSAATIINPERMLYLYSARTEDDIKQLLETIPYVSEYMRKKKIRTVAEFLLLSDGKGVTFSEKTIEKIKKSGNGKIRQVKTFMGERKTRLQKLESYLLQRSKDKGFFALEANDSGLSNMLEGACFYDVFPSYRLDSKSMKFEEIKDCAMLEYIQKRPYISVMDMASIRLSSSQSRKQPEFYSDYKNLWETYNKKSWAWKKMCSILFDYADTYDQLESFPKKEMSEKKQQPEVYTYIVPFACRRNVEKILDALQKNGILNYRSRLESRDSSDSCQVIIADCWNYKQKYDHIFALPYKLMQEEFLTVHFDVKAQVVRVLFNDLEVREADISGNRKSEITNLLKYFQTRGYIHNLTVSADNKVSFTYATSQIKELLTTEGKILEVYTYHKIKETGAFDDVVSSIELDWENPDIKNEFDCILTRGFQSLFVECKARADLDQNFYYKLDSLTRHFGINAKAVLVADTRENSLRNGVLNSLQRERGSLMGTRIITIWKKDEIADIGNILVQVFDGTYQEKNEVQEQHNEIVH